MASETLNAPASAVPDRPGASPGGSSGGSSGGSPGRPLALVLAGTLAAALSLGLLGLAGRALIDGTPPAGDAPIALPRIALPIGPLLEQARQRGVLRVGVREYARPAPPGQPLPAEPDDYDAALAGVLAEQLGVRLELVGLADAAARRAALAAGRIDLLLAGAPAADTRPGAAVDTPVDTTTIVPAAYIAGAAEAVVLRGSGIQDWADLRGRSVCVGEGSPHAATVAQDHGARPRSYRSGVHAVYGFMAGECEALLEDHESIQRLLQIEEWRFYQRLPGRLVAPASARPHLAQADAQGGHYLASVLAAWSRSGALEQARGRRAANLFFEALQLQDGAICH